MCNREMLLYTPAKAFQVIVRMVAGLQKSSELQRYMRWEAVLRSRSALFCRPGTLLGSNWDAIPVDLRHGRAGLRWGVPEGMGGNGDMRGPGAGSGAA